MGAWRRIGLFFMREHQHNPEVCAEWLAPKVAALIHAASTRGGGKEPSFRFKLHFRWFEVRPWASAFDSMGSGPVLRATFGIRAWPEGTPESHTAFIENNRHTSDRLADWASTYDLKRLMEI